MGRRGGFAVVGEDDLRSEIADGAFARGVMGSDSFVALIPSGDAEIDDLDAAIVTEHEVGWLDIAVDQIEGLAIGIFCGVCIGKTLKDLRKKREDDLPRQGSFVRGLFAQRGRMMQGNERKARGGVKFGKFLKINAVQDLHLDAKKIAGGIAESIVDFDEEFRVLEAAGDHRLGEEEAFHLFGGVAGCWGRIEQLESDFGIKPPISVLFGSPDLGLSTVPQRFFKDILFLLLVGVATDAHPCFDFWEDHNTPLLAKESKPSML